MECYKCAKVGHLRSQCAKVKAVLKNKSVSAHYLGHEEEGNSSADELKFLEGKGQQINGLMKPFEVEVFVNGCSTIMEVDTGIPWSILPASAFRQISRKSKLKPCHTRLNSYTGSAVKILGEAEVQATLPSTRVKKTLTMLVVEKGAS